LTDARYRIGLDYTLKLPTYRPPAHRLTLQQQQQRRRWQCDAIKDALTWREALATAARISHVQNNSSD